LSNFGFYQLGSTVVLNAEALDPDGNVAQVTYYANGAMIGTALPGRRSRFSLTWQPTQPGFYRMQALAVDNAGGSVMSRPVLIRVGN
jgi:YD repeat-containing protein